MSATPSIHYDKHVKEWDSLTSVDSCEDHSVVAPYAMCFYLTTEHPPASQSPKLPLFHRQGRPFLLLHSQQPVLVSLPNLLPAQSQLWIALQFLPPFSVVPQFLYRIVMFLRLAPLLRSCVRHMLLISFFLLGPFGLPLTVTFSLVGAFTFCASVSFVGSKSFLPSVKGIIWHLKNASFP